MISALITSLTLFLAVMFVVMAAALTVAMFDFGGVSSLFVWWFTILVIVFVLIRWIAFIESRTLAVVMVRLGTVAALIMFVTGMMLAASAILGVSPLYLLPFAVGFGLLICVYDEETRSILLTGLPKLRPIRTRRAPRRLRVD